jgi:hypothetical protein
VSCFQSSLLQLDGADSINDKFQGFFWPGLDSELIEISLGAFKAKLFKSNILAVISVMFIYQQ